MKRDRDKIWMKVQCSVLETRDDAEKPGGGEIPAPSSILSVIPKYPKVPLSAVDGVFNMV